jgi:hypothetical protein
MFSFSILSVLMLAACSDYQLNSEREVRRPAGVDEDTGSYIVDTNEDDSDVPSEETGDTAEVLAEDTGLEPDGECGFHIQNGPMDEAFVQSYPTYSLQTEEVDTLVPSEQLQLWFGVTADPCGDIEVIVLQYAISDWENGALWLMPVYNEEANMYDPSDEFVFDATPPNGVVPDKELHFTWSDGFWPLGYDFTGEMDTVLIAAGETKWLVYEFPHTELAPVGTIADLMLSTIIWRDIGTEQEVQGWNDGHTDMWTTVQFVE